MELLARPCYAVRTLKSVSNVLAALVMTGLLGLALSLLPATGHAAPLGGGLFGVMEIKAPQIESIPKWVEVLRRIHNEQPEMDACQREDKACANQNMREWARMLRHEANDSPAGQLAAVNTFINHFKYITDQDNYGVSDYWATPKEFLTRSGDCEDFAIAKFVSLKMLGWHDSRLRLVVVQDTIKGVPHAILSAQLNDGSNAAGRDGKFMILDNLATQPLPDSYVLQYNPYYAVNETTRWVFIKPLMLDPAQSQMVAGGNNSRPAADR